MFEAVDLVLVLCVYDFVNGSAPHTHTCAYTNIHKRIPALTLVNKYAFAYIQTIKHTYRYRCADMTNSQGER